MNRVGSTPAYFKHLIPISAQQWQLLVLEAVSRQICERKLPQIIFYRQLALSLNKAHSFAVPTVSAAQLNLFAILQAVCRYMIDVLAENELIGALERAMQRAGYDPAGDEVTQAAASFVALFPPAEGQSAPAT